MQLFLPWPKVAMFQLIYIATFCMHLTFSVFLLHIIVPGALLEHAEALLDMGIHPLRVAEGYEMACKVATDHLDKIATDFTFTTKDIEPLVQTCMTTLSSKV